MLVSRLCQYRLAFQVELVQNQCFELVVHRLLAQSELRWSELVASREFGVVASLQSWVFELVGRLFVVEYCRVDADVVAQLLEH